MNKNYIQVAFHFFSPLKDKNLMWYHFSGDIYNDLKIIYCLYDKKFNAKIIFIYISPRFC